MATTSAIYFAVGLAMAVYCYRDQPMIGFLAAVVLFGPFLLMGYLAKEIIVRMRPDIGWERH